MGQAATTAVWQTDSGIDERTIPVGSVSESDQEPLQTPDDRARIPARQVASPERTQIEQQRAKPSAFIGSWAAEAASCGVRSNKSSDLLTLVDERGARAGESSCTFKTRKQIAATEWEMGAACTDRTNRWSSNVRLTVSGNRLKWSSQRGSQTYVRCGNPNFAQLVNP
jgi:hypothetical protein